MSVTDTWQHHGILAVKVTVVSCRPYASAFLVHFPRLNEQPAYIDLLGCPPCSFSEQNAYAIPPYNHFVRWENILQIIAISKIISPHTNCMGGSLIYECRLLTEVCMGGNHFWDQNNLQNNCSYTKCMVGAT